MNQPPVPHSKLVFERSVAPKKISKIQFCTFSSPQVHAAAELQITSRELFKMPQRSAAPYGCLDPKLGVSDKQSSCQTCK